MLILMYPILGFLFKFAERKSRYEIIFGILCGILAGFLISENRYSTLLLGGILIGLFIYGRLNYPGHRLGIATIIIIVLYFGNPIVPLMPLLAISFAFTLDQKYFGMNQTTNILLILFTIFEILPLSSTAAFFSAEIAYKLGGLLVEKRKPDYFSFRPRG